MQYFRDLVLAFRDLELDGSRPVLVHASLSAFGHVKGGAEAVVGALMEHFNTVVMPTFTYQTMIIPAAGPANNAMKYGRMEDRNRMAEFYYPDMPSDKTMGIIPETLRRHKMSQRSRHPIMSFSGVNADKYLSKQSMNAPLAPLEGMVHEDAWVIMLGVPHTTNTSIHLGEQLAGRRTFVRWALMPDLIVECKGFPSCSDGFDAIQPHIEHFVREIKVGESTIQAMPMIELVATARALVEADPLILLCERPECDRCIAVRESVMEKSGA